MNTMVTHHPLPMGQSMGLDYVSVLKQNYKIIIINGNLKCKIMQHLLIQTIDFQKFGQIFETPESVFPIHLCISSLVILTWM